MVCPSAAACASNRAGQTCSSLTAQAFAGCSTRLQTAADAESFTETEATTGAKGFGDKDDRWQLVIDAASA